MRAELERIFAAAVEAVDPAMLVRRHLRVDRGETIVVDTAGRELTRWRGPSLVVGAGKAAARMAAGCEEVLEDVGLEGSVIVADGCSVALKKVEVFLANHPLPDRRGEAATAKLCGLLARPGAEPVLCLLSGGASSLLVWPHPEITLQEKCETCRLLYESGADIAAVNTVRKHLSRVKGGGLLRYAGGRSVVTLILSDVVGDDPSVIGSGPTVADGTTFAEACTVLRDFGLERRVPTAVRSFLRGALCGAATETVKSGDPIAAAERHIVIGSNRTALAGAAKEAERLGYRAVILDGSLRGDTCQAAERWLTEVRRRVLDGHGRGVCVLAGGETTVHVDGTGRGGRNQEFALALARPLAGERISVLSAGTDGIDGPTDAAGAFVDGDTASRAADRGLRPETFLANNDSYAFFDVLNDLFRPGPTGTNVMDIKVALVPTSDQGPVKERLPIVGSHLALCRRPHT